jgi:hypothetical protein
VESKPDSLPSPLELQTLHKACGGVEIAQDLVWRSGSLYAGVSGSPDHGVMESFMQAADALALVVETLRGQLRRSSLGPAA